MGLTHVLPLSFLAVFATFALVKSNGNNHPPPDPVVQLPEFKATGLAYSYKSDLNGQTFVTNAFLSLPYALPPTGARRLEKPVPLPINPNKQVVGQDLPPGCVQQEDLAVLGADLPALYPVSEDCLYLNVMTPKQPPPPGKKYPVLVWIHGGGFVYGMSRFYGWQQLARHFNPRGVIVVGIQYRLAFWGFWSLGTTTGNLGLYDQSLALKWINTHVKYFNGDPNQITVWGNSAGSASTHSQTLSPLSNKYFRYSIQSSGSLYNMWTHANHTREISANVTATLGCSSGSLTAVKACLKTKSIQQIWNAAAPYKRMNNAMDTIHWAPLADEAFFAGKSIHQLTVESPIRNTLYGSAYGEGIMMTLQQPGPVTSVFAYWLGIPFSEETTYNKANFSEYLTNYLNLPRTSGSNYTAMQPIFENYYYRDEADAPNDPRFWYYRYTDSQSDGTFKAGMVVEAREKLAIGGRKMYWYVFDYIHPSHVPLFGVNQTYAPHAYEYQYLTDCAPYFPFLPNETNSVEFAFTQKLVAGMAQFVKTGNPSTPQLPWPIVNDPVNINYMLVGDTVAAGNTHFAPISQTWSAIYGLGYGSPVLV